MYVVSVECIIGYNICVYAMEHMIWSNDDFAMGLCKEHSGDGLMVRERLLGRWCTLIQHLSFE